jgi:hypothetical protein
VPASDTGVLPVFRPRNKSREQHAMRRFLIASLFAYAALICGAFQASAQPTPPNILVIFGDDIG